MKEYAVLLKNEKMYVKAAHCAIHQCGALAFFDADGEPLLTIRPDAWISVAREDVEMASEREKAQEAT